MRRTARGGLRLGAAYETVDDCRFDLLAWVAWLRQHVGPRVALAGHSLGAVKCLYAAAHDLATVIRAWIDRDAIAEALGLTHDQQGLFSQTVGYPKR